MTDKQVLTWIKNNLSKYIIKAVEGSPFSEDLLAAIAMRETGFLIGKFAFMGMNFKEICEKMKGDWSQRKGESDKSYHGLAMG